MENTVHERQELWLLAKPMDHLDKARLLRVYFGCWILDSCAIDGLLLNAFSWVGVTVTIFFERVRVSGNVGAATTICSWSIGSPKMSLGTIAEDVGTLGWRAFFDTLTPCIQNTMRNQRPKEMKSIRRNKESKRMRWLLTATRTALVIVFFMVW